MTDEKVSRSSIHIIEIAPVEMMGVTWLCVGFEPQGEHMGDAMHLAFLYKEKYQPSEDLHRDAEEILTTYSQDPLVRIHSECLLGDAMHSNLCDCGEQLHTSQTTIIQRGCGAVLYLRQEGRGIGMRAKLACLAAQEGYVRGIKSIPAMTPDEANIYHGYAVDERCYEIVPRFLRLLGVHQVVMMTGNLEKVNAVRGGGIQVSALTDIDRSSVVAGSRKHRELVEKAKRHYNYTT